MTSGQWAALAATSFFAALLQAVNGFGFAVLAVPFFLLAAPAGEAIQIILLLSLALSLIVVPGVWPAVQLPLLARLTVGSLVGLPLGLVAFAHSDPLVVRAAVGAMIVVFAAVLAENRWRGRPAVLELRPAGDLVAGVVAGAATALVGMSGPPVLIYLMLAGAPARTARATLLSFFALIYGATVAANMAVFGISAEIWTAAAALAPLAWVGGFLGVRLGNRLDPRLAANSAIALLAAAGLYTLADAAAHGLW